MTYEEKVRWLRRYKLEMQKEQELAVELIQLRKRATAIEVHIGDMPKGEAKFDTILTAVASIIEAEKELGEQVRRCSLVRSEVVEAIDSIPNEREQIILRYRYIIGFGWEKIAEKVDVCPKWCKVLHDKAIKCLVIDGGIDDN